jgi:DNA-binding FadR family transcriptional regulator
LANGRRSRVPQLRIAESVAAELRERILASDDDEYRLPTQDQLVEEFGVSYPSVREAIRILETEGLVTVRRGNVGGAEVHRPDESSAAYALGLALQGARITLTDLAEGLQTLEPMCAAACARVPARNDRIVPALTENLEKTASLVGDGVKFTHTAREFHDVMVAFTPNATIRYVVSSLVALWTAQEEAWAESMASRGEYFTEAEAKEVIRTHKRILKEIAAGRATEAERIARVHLAATQELFLSRFPNGIVQATSTRARQAITSMHSRRV